MSNSNYKCKEILEDSEIISEFFKFTQFRESTKESLLSEITANDDKQILRIPEELKRKIIQFTNLYYEQKETILLKLSQYISDYINKINCKLNVQHFYDRTEIQIRLLKYLQGEPKERSKIAEFFNTSNNTINSWIKTITEEDAYVLGQSLEGHLKLSHNTFNYTAHPIFLNLNLVELNMLLTVLKQNEDNKDIEKIINDIEYQMTDYAKATIKNELNYLKKPKRAKLSPEETEDLGYYLKASIKVKVKLRNIEAPLIGIIKYINHSYSINGQEFRAQEVENLEEISEKTT